MTATDARPRTWTLRLAALTVTAAFAVACADRISTTGGGAADGAGFTEISVPEDARTNQVRVSPDEQYLVITTSAGHWNKPPRRIVVYDAALRRVSDADLSPNDVAFSSDGTRIVHGEGTLTALSLPSLRFHDTAALTADVHRVVERPGASGWFVVARRGEDGIVEILDDSNLSIGRRGTFGTGVKQKGGVGWLRAATLDARTGRLVLLLKPNQMESFDPQLMRSTWRVDLPCVSVGFDVAVADGFAFVPTEQGTVLVVDAVDGTVVRTVETGGRQVALSLSRTGHTLAVVTRELQDDNTVRVGLRVFARHGGDLTPLAATERTLRHAPNDVAVIEGSRVVILTGDETLAWHY